MRPLPIDKSVHLWNDGMGGDQQIHRGLSKRAGIVVFKNGMPRLRRGKSGQEGKGR